MHAILIMLPILIYAFITAVAVVYVFVVVLPRLRGRKETPAARTAIRRR